jgi:hypothetical protein
MALGFGRRYQSLNFTSGLNAEDRTLIMQHLNVLKLEVAKP